MLLHLGLLSEQISELLVLLKHFSSEASTGCIWTPSH